MLTDEVVAKLSKPLDKTRIKTRQGGGGMQLAYLKGHDVIDQANAIFGFGAWGYDLLNVELVSVVGEDGQVGGGYYAARVRLTVAGCQPITEEGVCPIQDGRNPRARIDAHDMARKGAVTDAMKRAFRCFGDQFGNSLYDNEPGGDGDTRKSPPAAQATQQNRQAQPQQAATPVTPAIPWVAPASTPQQPQSQSGEMATAQQRQGILRLAGNQGMEEIEINRRLKDLYACNLDNLNRVDAAHFIKVLQDK